MLKYFIKPITKYHNYKYYNFFNTSTTRQHSFLSSFGMSFQLRYLIGHIWGFHAIVPKKPVKVLTPSSIGRCILFSSNSISWSSGRSQISKYLLGLRVTCTASCTSEFWRRQYQPMSNNKACKTKDESKYSIKQMVIIR